ncbi:MAG: DNA repair protein RecN [Oscillospiraceae bacterium]|jgi:DNA repair protein RecN (Recombination protein N)|nr:DNA repair protein RecN [Oscillospiraceae bacterium]
MLHSLTIENIAVIKRAQLELPEGAGFIAITGETGAGKSIVIDALHAVLGERTSRDLIRTGAESARVTAQFFCEDSALRALLDEMDLPAEEDGTLVLHRAITQTGKNSCRVNGLPVPVASLKKIGQLLVHIHGQYDNQALLDPARHLDFIDAVAENEGLREEYAAAYHALRSLQKEQNTLQMDENEKARRLDMLRHQVAELEEAEIVPGDQTQLRQRREVMRNSEKIIGALQEACQALAGADDGEGASGLAFGAAAALERAADFLPDAQGLCDGVRGAAYELEESAAELRSLLETVAFDPAEADAVERRLDVYYRLGRKYGTEEDDMLAFLAHARAEEASITRSDARIAALEEEIATQKAATIALARQLSKTRREAGMRFAARVREELAGLDMPHAVLEVQTEKVPLTAQGGERLEFLFSANAGENGNPKPLAKIASGGEISRVMLAIKAVLAKKDTTGTLIFDEIDAGVSGRAAEKIGLKLRQVACGRQVICVTHLAQIAALAKTHLFIQKSVAEGETQTKITLLAREARVEEIARIMGGTQRTAAQLAAAAEMLGFA